MGSARELDSAGCNWASELDNREATRVGLPWEKPGSEPKGTEGLKGSVAAEKTGNDKKATHRMHQVIGDRMAGSVGEISSELAQGSNGVSGHGPKSRPGEVRASVVAKKRVMTVEPRDAGK